MKDIIINSVGVSLVAPDPERDAPFALDWFRSEFGRETLLLMGNAENEIEESTLESEKKILHEFLQLEQSGEQLTWMIRKESRTLGAVWIELKDSGEVKSPAVHIMLGDKESRGKGIGRSVLLAVLQFIHDELHMHDVYSRHLAGNETISHVMQSLGFVNDGKTYNDANGLVWQNVVLNSSKYIQ